MTDRAHRWRRVEQLCAAALERTGVERTAFLRDACGDDEALRREVEQLLAQESQADGFLHGSVATVAAAVMGPTTASLTGHRLNALEVGALIGAGGMGEVYRARDTELKRDVALKVLPAALASDAERLARFRREAEVLASLNHPHIAAIYGLEKSEGVTALVMELVEGEDLSARIATGRVPLDEALAIARQVAEALEAAHERGIIHRDLKPANIKVRSDGTVKVLDFGLAKAIEQGSGIREQGSGSASISPTITSPAVMTGMGVILGTAAYMSPEQARGAPVDKRSDIWSFGVVLYEMLAGQRPFKGEDTADMVAAVLREDVDWNGLPPSTPAVVRHLLTRCLEKDPTRRLRDIGEARIVLSNGNATSSSAPLDAPSRRTLPMWRLTLVAGFAVLLAAVGTGGAVWFATRPPALGVVRFGIGGSGVDLVTLDADGPFAITADGARIVYAGNDGTQLFVRALDDLEPRIITSGVGLRAVSISPDGQWIAFVDSSSTLKKVAITGGPGVIVTQMDAASRGVTWASNDTIMFGTIAVATGLQQVSAGGGTPVVLTMPDTTRGDGDHWWPETMPGGESVLFTVVSPNGRIEDSQIAILNLRTRTSQVVLRGASHAHYVPTGHLVYGAEGTLYAVPFSLERLAVTGTAVPVTRGVLTTGRNAAVAVAANGSLVYLTGGARGGTQQTVTRVDRQGRGSPLVGLPTDAYRDVRLSPDGTQLALATQDDVFVYNFQRTTRIRLTTDPAVDRSPLWTLNGRRIVFTSRRSGFPEMFSRLADGSGSEERLLAGSKDFVDLRANQWTADGKQLLYTEVLPAPRGAAIKQAALADLAHATLLVATDSPSPVSPRGGWMAYQSRVSGSTEIYVERYPDLGDRKPISVGGGRLPVWSADGRELFFTNGRQMLAVPIEYGPTLSAGRPEVLFEASLSAFEGNRPYDVTADGQFLMIVGSRTGSSLPPQIVVAQNWTEELKRLVPAR